MAVTIEKKTTRQVRCEQCNCFYVYEASRKATRKNLPDNGFVVAGIAGGIIGGLLWAAIRSGSTKDDSKLHDQAERDAQKQIDRAVEIVPCPDCGWYQKDMIAEARRRARRGKPMVTLICLASFAAIALFFMLSVNSDKHTRNAMPQGAIWIAGAIAAACLGWYVVRWVQLGKLDVNAGFPTQRSPFNGAPPARKVVAALSIPTDTAVTRGERTGESSESAV